MRLNEFDELVGLGYPRPEMARSSWDDLSGEWELGFDDLNVGVKERWWDSAHSPLERRIQVPYPVECRLSGVGDRSFHGCLWYRRVARLPVRREGERLLLHFGAVDYCASVWVNNAYLGSHEGGQTPFEFDVEEAVAGVTGEVTIAVRVEDDPVDLAQPRGKQDWQREPHAIWYERTSGIWQTVWWEVVPRCHVTALNWEVRPDSAEVAVHVELSEVPAAGSEARVVLNFDDDRLAEVRSSLSGKQTSVILVVDALRNGWDRSRLEWSPSVPTLLTADVEIVDCSGEAIDSVASYLGIRTVEAENNRFMINGRPEYLRLALSQGYWPESHLAAPDLGALRREIELTKALGFNGVRVHQKIEDPRFLYWADRLGLMVWEEMPSAGRFSNLSVRRLIHEWQDVVRRDRNHPSIVAWVPMNESWGVPDLANRAEQRELLATLYHLTRTLDTSRPVISNDGWQHLDSDIWTVHDYARTGATLRERYGSRDAIARVLDDRWPGHAEVVLSGGAKRGQPMVLSEFGGVTYCRQGGEAWLGYGSVESADELAATLRELIGAVVSSLEVVGFCYTQLTDTEQERNGLLYADRTPKLPVQDIRAIVTQPAKSVASEEMAEHVAAE